jgi:hypothetical protein
MRGKSRPVRFMQLRYSSPNFSISFSSSLGSRIKSAPDWHVSRYLWPDASYSSSTWVELAPYLDSLTEVFDLTFEHLHGAPSGIEQ